MHVYNNTIEYQSVKNNCGDNNIGIDSKCTELFETVESAPSKSCAKIVLVHIRNPNFYIPPLKIYAIIDDQSKCKPELLNFFDIRTAAITY